MLLSFLYLSNEAGLFKHLGFSGSIVVMGDTGVGKTSTVMNALGATSSTNNMITGRSQNKVYLKPQKSSLRPIISGY